MVEFKLEGFPFKPPVIAVKTKIFHPNIDEKGLVCEDMLETGSKWAPTKKLCAVMDKLKSLLVAPSSDNALNPDCAKIFTSDRAKWFSEAQKWTQQYAK